ncbi:MAG: 16S rRNA (cytosine(967)-C(5))-methyltransferase RsmB [Kiritimatiellia bacterium]
MPASEKSFEPDARALTAGLIEKWLVSGAFPDRLLNRVSSDRAVVTEMLYGVVRHRRKLEWIAEHCANRSLDPGVTPYVLLGLYQIMEMRDVAEHAALNETVEAVKSGFRDASVNRRKGVANFVNALLRRVLREREAIKNEVENLPLEIRESHPDILVQRWTKHWGRDRTERICAWNNSRPAVTLRIDSGRTTACELISEMKRRGMEGKPHSFAPEECVTLPRGVAPADVPGYSRGLFTVQDPSTLSAVRLLKIEADSEVLDCCAAPGGKAVHIGWILRSAKQLCVADLSAERTKLLRENLRRCGLETAAAAALDASRPEEIRKAFGNRTFDRVLLDVPCTSTGAIRRRPDVKWRFSTRRLLRLVSTQRAILQSASGFVRPGGRLVYSICSLEPEESEEIIASWLDANPSFRLLSSKHLAGPETETDGVYAAAVEKVK